MQAHLEVSPTRRKQRTLQRPVVVEGIGLHTGVKVTMRLLPAEVGRGILFRRMDLGEAPLIEANLSHVCGASERCTVLGKDDVRVYTVEHLLAALYANNVDNCIVELSEREPPIVDGSSAPFVSAIQQAGFVEQETWRHSFSLTRPLWWSQGATHLIALPDPEYRVSYTLSYPAVPPLEAQYFSSTITSKSFNEELSLCRTFCRYEEISFLLDQGLIRGGSLDNAVVIHGTAIYSKEGLRFPNEMVRHKVLDLVGDLALMGVDFSAHIVAIRAGHTAHCALARLMLAHFTSGSVL